LANFVGTRGFKSMNLIFSLTCNNGVSRGVIYGSALASPNPLTQVAWPHQEDTRRRVRGSFGAQQVSPRHEHTALRSLAHFYPRIWLAALFTSRRDQLVHWMLARIFERWRPRIRSYEGAFFFSVHFLFSTQRMFKFLLSYSIVPPLFAKPGGARRLVNVNKTFQITPVPFW